MKSKETKQNFALIVKVEITPPEEMIPLLEEFKPPWHHSASTLHDFKDPSMRKESASDENFQVFKFISPIIGTWAQREHDPSLSYNYKEMYGLSSYK